MCMSKPKISIIVPVYNVENYLQRCIDSILTQSFTDFELLLIDDGSKDKSGDICDEYAHKDDRVNVFHKENGGVSSATMAIHVLSMEMRLTSILQQQGIMAISHMTW